MISVVDTLLSLPNSRPVAVDVPAELRQLIDARTAALPLPLARMEVASFSQPRCTLGWRRFLVCVSYLRASRSLACPLPPQPTVDECARRWEEFSAARKAEAKVGGALRAATWLG